MTSRTPGVCAVTGASGYVGSIIMRELQQHMPVVAMARHPQSEADILWSLESDQGIAKALRARNVKTLVHAAWICAPTALRKWRRRASKAQLRSSTRLSARELSASSLSRASAL